MQTIQIAVNKKEEVAGKIQYVELAKHDIFVPTVAEIGLVGKQALAEDGKTLLVDEDGLAVYEDDKLNWVQRAMLSQAKAQARNKIEAGTGQLKAGAAIADTWEKLVEIGTGGGAGNAEGLKNATACKVAFGKYIAGLKKSAGTQALITGLFSSAKGLALQDSTSKEKMTHYVTEFAATITPEQATQFGNYLTSIGNALTVTTDVADF